MSELQLIRPRAEDISGQPILRPLPSAHFRSIGPFVFFDHMLEHDYPAGKGMNIAQHPHIGLSTLTYLFEGQLQHKDSLGSDQLVGPGDVSWMTAGRAVAHVERTPPEQLGQNKRAHGLQVWLALPEAEEQCEPTYSHHPAASLPRSEAMGVQITLIAGSGFCLESPVPVRSPTLYAELRLAAGANLLIPTEHSERALYLGPDRRRTHWPTANQLELRRHQPGADRPGAPALGRGRLAASTRRNHAHRTATLKPLHQ